MISFDDKEGGAGSLSDLAGAITGNGNVNPRLIRSTSNSRSLGISASTVTLSHGGVFIGWMRWVAVWLQLTERSDGSVVASHQRRLSSKPSCGIKLGSGASVVATRR